MSCGPWHYNSLKSSQVTRKSHSILSRDREGAGHQAAYRNQSTCQCIRRGSILLSSIMFNRDLSKGSAELLVLTLLEARPRHGYDIGKLIEERTKGQIRFRIGSLYPILFRLEDRGLIAGRWLEKPGERRRRLYRLTPAGRKFLKDQRSAWDEFVATINQIVRPSHA